MPPFISYAQNFEDIVLWRALKQIENGFYVDVGAQDPRVESVTFAFYERGWSGINIEPVDEFYSKLAEARPRDINLKVAVGRDPGLRTLYAFRGSGLSTLDGQISARHENTGLAAEETVVPVLTLTKIIDDAGAPTIHFLKIDVEGAEGEVIESLDLDRIRPWIIVVEATEPNSTVLTREKWEHLVTDRGYCFAYFDGINCFYIAKEMEELKERLAVPANFLDNFVRASEWAQSQRAAALQEQIIDIRKALQQEVIDVQTARQQEVIEVRTALEQAVIDVRTQLDATRTELEAQKNSLLGRIHQLEAQLAVPSIDRFLGRLLSSIRNRLTRRSSDH
jgi:FkbM family methyltransferase